MTQFMRAIASRVVPLIRTHTVCQRASIYTRPPKEKIGPKETCIAMSMFFLAILGPSGWVLAHLEDYKKRE
ncbi:cytochrome c oxidase subunit 8A, mitochondrial [Antennarius striatus]|uniref:cytochrome c oxidase subunit 8A, mitochondrial n=1 Tax=Antennarius striatus TaxID=241820 RepID=UPI0035AF7EF6